jgi:GR25 family glycosyltransferase involved in LPS biosynthesis
MIICSLIVVHYAKPLHSSRQFDAVYLINLARRPDRFNSFLQVYKQSDMHHHPIIRMSAIDGYKLNLKSVPLTDLAKLEMKQLETTGFRYKHYQLTKGAIGCYLSHIKIWERMLVKQHSQVIVFEDDARIPPNTFHQVKQFMKTIPDDWDIILLGKYCNDCHDMGHYHKINRFILLHAYIIRATTVEKIINMGNIFPISQQLDAYLSEISDVINIYSPKYNIVSQSRSRTDIQAPIIKSKLNDKRLLVSH